ncbi:hypothetical protein LGW32_02595 [Streptococcus mutans]|nr:hypothetical protein [Streptococcus mutans]
MRVTDKAVSKWERDLSFPDINSIPNINSIPKLKELEQLWGLQ